jgi:hypothetical protein
MPVHDAFLEILDRYVFYLHAGTTTWCPGRQNDVQVILLLVCEPRLIDKNPALSRCKIFDDVFMEFDNLHKLAALLAADSPLPSDDALKKAFSYYGARLERACTSYFFGEGARVSSGIVRGSRLLSVDAPLTRAYPYFEVPLDHRALDTRPLHGAFRETILSQPDPRVYNLGEGPDVFSLPLIAASRWILPRSTPPPFIIWFDVHIRNQLLLCPSSFLRDVLAVQVFLRDQQIPHADLMCQWFDGEATPTGRLSVIIRMLVQMLDGTEYEPTPADTVVHSQLEALIDKWPTDASIEKELVLGNARTPGTLPHILIGFALLNLPHRLTRTHWIAHLPTNIQTTYACLLDWIGEAGPLPILLKQTDPLWSPLQSLYLLATDPLVEPRIARSILRSIHCEGQFKMPLQLSMASGPRRPGEGKLGVLLRTLESICVWGSPFPRTGESAASIPRLHRTIWAGEEAHEVWPSFSEGTDKDLERMAVVRNRMNASLDFGRSEFPTARSLSSGLLEEALEKVKRMRCSSQ